MKIDNVPTKEWMDSMREERNAQIIKDKENQYGVTIFHNEEQKALKQACLTAITSHDWFIDGVKDIDKEAFIEDLKRLTKEGLFILARHTGEMKAELYCRGKSYYESHENKIYTNLRTTPLTHGADKAIGFKIGMRAFLHETGHWLDNNVLGVKNGIRDKLPELDAKIKNDVCNFINKMGNFAYKNGYIKSFSELKQLTESSIRRTPKLVKDLMSELIRSDINSSISDLYSGASNGQVEGDYKHNNDYWTQKKGRLATEAVAHLNEALCTGEKRVNAMQKFLPTTWNYFILNIGRLLK